MMGIRGLITLTWTALVAAQFPPKPEGVTVLKSKFNENVTISYKEVRRHTGHQDTPR